MFNKLFRRLRRTARNWTTDPTRADRNAVIQRIVTAAAKESKDQASGLFKRTATPLPAPSPIASQLLGQEVDEKEESPIPAEEIGARAREIWIRNGQPAGTAASDWSQAEAELRAERKS